MSHCLCTLKQITRWFESSCEVPLQMKAFRLNKCENYGIKNCMSSTLKDISCQKKNNFSESVEFQLLLFLPNSHAYLTQALTLVSIRGRLYQRRLA